MAKQSATNPTTAVMYLRQVWHGKFSDIEIFCGEDGQRGQWIYQTTPYADYGMHFYSAWTETGGSDGQVQFNAFSNISIFGAKQAGVFFDGTPGEIYLTTQQTLPSLTVGNYLRGGTSKSTARIVAIDASNNRIFLDRWHGCYFSSGQGPFITGETLCETTQRDDGGAGTWDTGKYANNSASKAFTANLIGAVDNGFHELETKGCNIGVYTLVGRNNFYGGEIHGSNTSNPNIYSESSARNRFYGVKAENSSVNDVKVEYGYWNRGKNVYFSSTGGIPDDDTKRMHAVFSTYEYTYLYRTEFYGPDPQQTFYAPVSTTEVFRGRMDGDTNWRFIMRAAGDLRWGDGSNAVDVELRRSSANVLELAPGDVFRLDRVRFNPLSCAPSPTTDGDVAYADGTGWNPGSGAGLYVRTGGAWVKLH